MGVTRHWPRPPPAVAGWAEGEVERRAMTVDSRFLLGRYEVGSLLGSGGMAEVFSGFDRVLARQVAVKVLYTQYARNPALVERFKREARAAASLAHPGIVGVYDTGEQDGTHFIVMEYVDGRTLADILESDGPLDPARVTRIAIATCSALTAAHVRGLIHRDVKPANIMVTRRDLPKVMDFGIARLAEASGLTQTSNVIGTARYMSPEQAQAHDVDGRADLYSLGVCLYECLTGEPPFTGDSPVAVATKHVTEQPRPLRQLRPEIPAALEAVVLKAMAKDPRDRYQTAPEMRQDLERVLAGAPVEAGPVPLPAPVPVPALPPPIVDRTGPGEDISSGTHDAVLVEEAGDGSSPRRRITAVGLGLVLVLLLTALLTAQARRGGVPLDGPDDTASARLIVPYLVRYPEATARAVLIQRGFAVAGQVKRQSDRRIQAGSVVATDPPAGAEAEPGQAIVLIISSGSEGLQVPLVVGQQVLDARRYLVSLGFRVSTKAVRSNQPAGTVVGQDPLGGTLVTEPGRITLSVSSRRATTQTSMPLPVPPPSFGEPGSPPMPTSPPTTAPPTTSPPTTAPPTTAPPTTLPDEVNNLVAVHF
jgi:tRNA A-37 threonylcarbamoyl transferase component Bud32